MESKILRMYLKRGTSLEKYDEDETVNTEWKKKEGVIGKGKNRNKGIVGDYKKDRAQIWRLLKNINSLEEDLWPIF